MITVQAAIDSLKTQLHGLYDRNETDGITMLVLSDVTGFSKAKLKAFGDEVLNNEQYNRVKDIIGQLKTGAPVQYVLGYTEFYGLSFDVNRSVLIPRPETEELVRWVIENVPKSATNILDIGTGSGCIAISLKHELKHTKVSAIDISSTALATAKINAFINQCDVAFIEADILNSDGLHFDNKFDIIVSNPPYVTETDRLQMHANVTDHEPHNALFVPEDNPLIFYHAIANFAFTNLKNEGLLFFEINEGYGEQTVDLLKGKYFKNIELRQDIGGKDRMVKAAMP